MNDAFKSYGYHSSKGIQIEHCNCINASKFTVLAQTARSFPLSWSELFCAPNSHLPSNCPNNCRSLSHEKKSSIHERMWAKIKHTYTKDLGLCSAKTAPMENTQNSNQASEAERTSIEHRGRRHPRRHRCVLSGNASGNKKCNASVLESNFVISVAAH